MALTCPPCVNSSPAEPGAFKMFPLAQMPTQLPPLPEGPALENVRGPIELNSGDASWQIALAALALLLIAAGAAWLYLRSRRRPPVAISPIEATRAELNAAKQATDDERFVRLCANAVRRLIAAEFKLSATSQTSAELCASIPLEDKAKARLVDFLNVCDGVKFAGQKLSDAQREEILDTANSLIQEIERKEPLKTT